MYAPRRILAPVDFGTCSSASLAQAVAITRSQPEATLRVLHVYEPPYYAPEALVNLPGEPPLPMVDYVRQEAERQLEGFLSVRRDAADLGGRLDARIAAGLAFEEVPREARACGADLIVMGTHGRQGLSHLLLGSVAERVIRNAPCPVLVVRAGGQEPPAPLAFDRVLVPIDFGPDANAAARLGIAMSARGARGVTLLHVVPTPAYAGEVLVPRAGGMKLGEYLHDEAQARLEAFAAEVSPSPDERPNVLVLQGSPAEQTIHVCVEDDVHLVVMGTKGRHGLAHFFVGSVAERVLRHAHCPVLITRAVFGEPAPA
ncbi:universal stress protein [Myxococcota bacterium]|nr:universal stress protein [Myxococcota bacterium]